MAPKAFSLFDEDGNPGIHEQEVEDTKPGSDLEGYAGDPKPKVYSAKDLSIAIQAGDPASPHFQKLDTSKSPLVQVDYAELEKKLIATMGIPPEFVGLPLSSWKAELLQQPMSPLTIKTLADVKQAAVEALTIAGVKFESTTATKSVAEWKGVLRVTLAFGEPMAPALVTHKLDELFQHLDLCLGFPLEIEVKHPAMPLATKHEVQFAKKEAQFAQYGSSPHGSPSMFEKAWFENKDPMKAPNLKVFHDIPWVGAALKSQAKVVDDLALFIWKQAQAAFNDAESAAEVQKQTHAKLPEAGQLVAKLAQLSKLQKEVVSHPLAKHVPGSIWKCPTCGATEGEVHKEGCFVLGIVGSFHPFVDPLALDPLKQYVIPVQVADVPYLDAVAIAKHVGVLSEKFKALGYNVAFVVVPVGVKMGKPSAVPAEAKQKFVCLDCGAQFTKEEQYATHDHYCQKWKCSSCGVKFSTMPAPLKKKFGTHPLCAACKSGGSP